MRKRKTDSTVAQRGSSPVASGAMVRLEPYDENSKAHNFDGEVPDYHAGTSAAADYWACACVKRGADGKLSAIKLNHWTVRRCRKCGMTPLPPNAGTQRPGTPDGSLATETRKPGSLK